MILLSSLHSSLTASSSAPTPQSASSAAAAAAGPSGEKRPPPLDIRTQETLRGDDMDEIADSDTDNVVGDVSAGTLGSAPIVSSTLPTLPDDPISPFSNMSSPYSQSQSQSQTQNKKRRLNTEPDMDRASEQRYRASQTRSTASPISTHTQISLNDIVPQLTNLLLNFDTKQQSHRRKMESSLADISTKIMDKMEVIAEDILQSRQDSVRWKELILGKLDEVDGKNEQRVAGLENRLGRLEDTLGRLASQSQQTNENIANLQDSMTLNIVPPLQIGQQSRSQAIPENLNQPFYREPLQASDHPRSNEDDSLLAGMDLDVEGVEADGHTADLPAQPDFSDSVYFPMDVSTEDQFTDTLAPVQYSIDPKAVMLEPEHETASERGSTSVSASAARTGKGAYTQAENNGESSQSMRWWKAGGAKAAPRREADVDIETASEERLVTPQTETEERFHTASPDLAGMSDHLMASKTVAGANGVAESEAGRNDDSDSDSSRPPARLPFPPRPSQASPSAAKRRARRSDSSPALQHPKTLSPRVKTSGTSTPLKPEVPSRKSGRARSERVSYVPDLADMEEKKPKFKSKIKGVRQRKFYGQTRLTTKGLLTGDGIRITEAKWPQKGAYTVRSKLEEIICDACRGRCHWACAALDLDVDMSDRTWLCPDCEHIIQVDGKPRASIDTVQQVRCIRHNCVLRDKKAIEVREGEEDIYVIERLVGQRAIARVPGSHQRIFEYLVKWEGYDWNECSWEPVQHLAPRHENLIATFRETARSLFVDLKIKVAILPDARGSWDAKTGDSLTPESESDSRVGSQVPRTEGSTSTSVPPSGAKAREGWRSERPSLGTSASNVQDIRTSAGSAGSAGDQGQTHSEEGEQNAVEHGEGAAKEADVARTESTSSTANGVSGVESESAVERGQDGAGVGEQAVGQIGVVAVGGEDSTESEDSADGRQISHPERAESAESVENDQRDQSNN